MSRGRSPSEPDGGSLITKSRHILNDALRACLEARRGACFASFRSDLIAVSSEGASQRCPLGASWSLSPPLSGKELPARDILPWAAPRVGPTPKATRGFESREGAQ